MACGNRNCNTDGGIIGQLRRSLAALRARLSRASRQVSVDREELLALEVEVGNIQLLLEAHITKQLNLILYYAEEGCSRG